MDKVALEKGIQDILNAGIGLFRAGQANFADALKKAEAQFEDMKKKGSMDNSQAALKVREVLENTIRGVKDVSSKAEANFNVVLAEAQKNYTQVLDQIKQLVGEERIKDVNSKIEELAAMLKQKTGGAAAGPTAGKK